MNMILNLMLKPGIVLCGEPGQTWLRTYTVRSICADARNVGTGGILFIPVGNRGRALCVQRHNEEAKREEIFLKENNIPAGHPAVLEALRPALEETGNKVPSRYWIQIVQQRQKLAQRAKRRSIAKMENPNVASTGFTDGKDARTVPDRQNQVRTRLRNI